MHKNTSRAAASLLASCTILASAVLTGAATSHAAPLTASSATSYGVSPSATSHATASNTTASNTTASAPLPANGSDLLRTDPSVPVHYGQYAPGTTLAHARKAAGVTTGTPWPYDTRQNLEIPDPSAYQSVPEIRTPGCTLTAQHPYPVVLVHGTWANAEKWATLAPVLQKQGYCVFGMNYGFDARALFYNKPSAGQFGVSNLYASAIELDNYVNKVLALTGAKKVNLIGHSQAGIIFRLWLHDFRGNLRAARSITLAGTNHGTTLMGLSSLPLWKNPTVANVLSVALSTGAMQQVVGSPMVRYINTLPDTMPGVHYTALATKYDTTSTPYNATFLKAVPGATVTNVTVENVCRPGEMLDHNKLTTNQAVQVLVARALQDKAVTCAGTQWERR